MTFFLTETWTRLQILLKPLCQLTFTHAALLGAGTSPQVPHQASPPGEARPQPPRPCWVGGSGWSGAVQSVTFSPTGRNRSWSIVREQHLLGFCSLCSLVFLSCWLLQPQVWDNDTERPGTVPCGPSGPSRSTLLLPPVYMLLGFSVVLRGGKGKEVSILPLRTSLLPVSKPGINVSCSQKA